MVADGTIPRARGPHEIDVLELHRRLSAGESLLIVDVREPLEFEIARLPGVRTIEIPLSEFEARWPAELGPHQESEIVLMCRSGGRSARVQGYLAHVGFTGTRNLVGGILAWSAAIDPSVPRY